MLTVQKVAVAEGECTSWEAFPTSTHNLPTVILSSWTYCYIRRIRVLDTDRDTNRPPLTDSVVVVSKRKVYVCSSGRRGKGFERSGVYLVLRAGRVCFCLTHLLNWVSINELNWGKLRPSNVDSTSNTISGSYHYIIMTSLWHQY